MEFGLSKEQEMIKKEMERFCKKELNNEYVTWMDENVDFPPEELWQKLTDVGVFRSNVPVEYGGDGVGMLDFLLAYEPICKASCSVALAVACTAGFGTHFITELASEKQKQEYLPAIADGQLKSCMALTEPGGGTDILGSLSTHAQEKDGRWLINGEKVFITSAHASDIMIVICKTEENAKPSESLSVFIVPSDSDGITITKIPKLSCHHCDSVGITFKDVEIPKENLIGTKGRGWYDMLAVLNPERMIVAMMGVGMIEAAYEEAFKYAKERHAFGGPIARFQILQKYLADMLINLENSRTLTYKAAWLCDEGLPYHMEATMSKLVAAEGAMHAVVYGSEIFGGYGICNEYPMQRYVRDAFQIQFSPISNEMARNMMMQFKGLPKSWS